MQIKYPCSICKKTDAKKIQFFVINAINGYI